MRRRAIIALVFIVAGAVLVESWHAAKNAAATGGRPWPWLWPVTLEAFIFVLVLVYWDARSTGRSAPMARVLLAITTGVASAVQILDAPQTWLGWVTAGWTPVALLLSVEFAVWLLYGATTVAPTVPAPASPREPERPRPRVAQGAERRPSPATLGRPFTPADHEPVRAWVAQGRTNKAEMARELGLHKRGQLELGRYVNGLRDVPVQVGHRNGDGS